LRWRRSEREPLRSIARSLARKSDLVGQAYSLSVST
jgi:hypothetical protein